MEENRLKEETPDREAKGAPAESSVRVEARECAAFRESGSEPFSEPAPEPAVSFPCGRAGVEALLPHRDPFIWVSRILACEPGVSITAELDVDPALPLFAGHFPSHPVLPGVILMEALAQAASCCVLSGQGRAGAIGFLTGIDKAKFRAQVHPGDTVRLEARIIRDSSRMAVADVSAYVGDVLAAHATQKYVIARQG